MAEESNTQVFKKAEASQQTFKSNVEGIIVILVTVGYVWLVFVLVGLWSDKAGEAVIGFALFAQSIVKEYFTSKREQRQIADNKPPGTNPIP